MELLNIFSGQNLRSSIHHEFFRESLESQAAQENIHLTLTALKVVLALKETTKLYFMYYLHVVIYLFKDYISLHFLPVVLEN